MNITWKSLAVTTAFMSVGAAHAATQTLPVGGSVQVDRVTQDWDTSGSPSLTDLSGSLSWQFSPLFVSAMNVAKASLGEVGHADLTATYRSMTSSTGVVTTRLNSAVVAAPVVSLTGEFGEGQALIQQAASSGGVTFSTLKNGATNGAGSLQISNMKIDLPRGAVLADITGANGVGSMSGVHLWDYGAVTGPTTYLPPDFSGNPWFVDVHVANGFNGLFATAQGMELMAQALNLNNLGRAALQYANNPQRGDGSGFGSLTLDFSVRMSGPVAISLAVPEPSSWAMAVAGVFGLGFMARRRHSSMNRRGS